MMLHEAMDAAVREHLVVDNPTMVREPQNRTILQSKF